MMQAAPLITEELLDEDFFAELDALIDKDFEGNKEIQGENRNCGTGAVGGKQGFQPGNKCAGDGSKSKAKAEGKKKDVHSDWDDGATVDRYWEYDGPKDEFQSTFSAYAAKDGERETEYLYKLEADRTFDHPLDMSEDTPFYDVQFSLENSPTNNRFGISDTGTGQQVFRDVTNRLMSLYDDDEVSGLIFSSSTGQPSRTKLYYFLAKFAQKRRDVKALIDNNHTRRVVFHLVDKAIADDYKEIFRETDEPLDWLDETSREDLL